MDPDSDPDHSQNLITCSLSHLGHVLKISSKSVHKFLSYLVDKQTHKPTNKSRQKHNLLGGGNKCSSVDRLFWRNSAQTNMADIL